MTEQRNDGLHPRHPRHPGRGKCNLIAIESNEDEPEVGGFMIFLPSGSTKVVHWRSPKPITPTLECAKKYATEVVDSLLKQHGTVSCEDIQRTNWTSVAAAIQRIILDFNEKIVGRIDAKMARDAIEGNTVKAGPTRKILH